MCVCVCVCVHVHSKNMYEIYMEEETLSCIWGFTSYWYGLIRMEVNLDYTYWYIYIYIYIYTHTHTHTHTPTLWINIMRYLYMYMNLHYKCVYVWLSNHIVESNAQYISLPTTMIIPPTVGTYPGLNSFIHVIYMIPTSTYENIVKLLIYPSIINICFFGLIQNDNGNYLCNTD